MYRRYTNNDIIHITRDAIHLFINKNIDKFVQHFDEKFVFISDYDSLFQHGISKFMNYIEEEKDLPPVNIQQEEYGNF